ncbi:unnamed protein product, partial [Vitis vinifera]
MDSDHWSSRLAVAKRQFMLHQTNKSHSDRLFIDDLEVEDDIPCPYCYEDHDIASLCSHLEDEHSFESRVAVCPICSVKIARDMLGHITMQHRHFYLQRRRRLRRVAIPNSQALSLLGRDLREAHLQPKRLQNLWFLTSKIFLEQIHQRKPGIQDSSCFLLHTHTSSLGKYKLDTSNAC